MHQVYVPTSRPSLPSNILIAMHSKLNLSSSKHTSFWAFFLACFGNLTYYSHLITLLMAISSLSGLVLCMMYMVFCWEYVGVTPLSFRNIQLLFVVLSFLLYAILHSFSLKPSAVPTSQSLWFYMCSFQISCTTYWSFMAKIRHALFLSRGSPLLP